MGRDRFTGPLAFELEIASDNRGSNFRSIVTDGDTNRLISFGQLHPQRMRWGFLFLASPENERYCPNALRVTNCGI